MSKTGEASDECMNAGLWEFSTHKPLTLTLALALALIHFHELVMSASRALDEHVCVLW